MKCHTCRKYVNYFCQPNTKKDLLEKKFIICLVIAPPIPETPSFEVKLGYLKLLLYF